MVIPGLQKLLGCFRKKGLRKAAGKLAQAANDGKPAEN
jgi:hypothetical protein